MSSAKTTIVSAYYQVPSKASHDTYLKWMSNFLQIPAHLVVFTNDEMAPVIENLRSPLKDRTRVITLDYKDFNSHKHDEYWRFCKEVDTEPKHSPELYSIWYEKNYFV